MRSVGIDIKVETVEELKDGNKTGKKFKYADYQVKGNKKRIEERKKNWVPFNGK